MEAAYPSPRKGRERVAEKGEDYASMAPELLLKRAEKLEKQMLKHARDLEFEEAARLRDEIQRIRGLAMGTGLAPEQGLEYGTPSRAGAGK